MRVVQKKVGASATRANSFRQGLGAFAAAPEAFASVDIANEFHPCREARGLSQPSAWEETCSNQQLFMNTKVHCKECGMLLKCSLTHSHGYNLLKLAEHPRSRDGMRATNGVLCIHHFRMTTTNNCTKTKRNNLETPPAFGALLLVSLYNPKTGSCTP